MCVIVYMGVFVYESVCIRGYQIERETEIVYMFIHYELGS